MNLKMMNESFKRKYSATLTESIDESDKEQLRKALIMRSMNVISGGGNIKALEVALQDVIENFYPDHCWWEVTDCQIFNELLAGTKPREVCDMIVDQLKPEFAGNIEEFISENIDSQDHIGSDVTISQNAEDYFCEGEDDFEYIGSDGTLISHDTKTDRCKVKFSDGYVMTIPYEYLEINESLIESLQKCLNKLNEATISDEDKHDSALIRSMIAKLEKRSNARFTPEEQAVLDKYGITRDNWAKRLGVGDRELNPSYDGNQRKVYSGHQDWKGHYVRNGDPSKINYADRARKLKDRQFSGNTQVSGRYNANGAINAHTQQGGHTLQDVERAAVEDRDKKPADDMKRHLWDRKYHQDQIDGAQAEYDKSVGDARKKYDDSVRYATDTYRRHTVDAEQSRKRAQDKIDQMLRRK